MDKSIAVPLSVDLSDRKPDRMCDRKPDRMCDSKCDTYKE